MRRGHGLRAALKGVVLGWAVLALGAIAAPAFAQAPGHKGAKPDSKELIAVMDLQAVGASKAEATALSDRLREVMLKTGRFKLVERSQIDQVLNEQALQQTGCTSQDCAVQVGRILGVRELVVGRVVKISADVWLLSAVLLDVESAETLRAETVRHRGDFFALMDARVREIGQRMAAPPEAAPQLAFAETEPKPAAAAAAPQAAGISLPATGDLTAAQIRHLVSGNAFSGAAPKDSWTVHYAPDGKATLQDGDKTDVGRWSVSKQDRLCIQWERTYEGKRRCAGLRRIEGTRFAFVTAKGERPLTAEKIPAAQRGYRLAVFPGYFSGQHATSLSNGRPNTEWIVKAIRDAVKRDPALDVTFSYYDGFGPPAVTHRVSEERTWKGLLFKEIDKDYVRSWARDLMVDGALVMAVSVPGNGGPVDAALYDALRDRWYEHSGRWETRKLGVGVRAAIDKVVTEFKERNP